MSSITFADHKTGGRLTAAADAIAAGHLNRAAGILAELADELNVEATEAGLLSEEAEPDPKVGDPVKFHHDGEVDHLVYAGRAEASVPSQAPAQPVDMQSCARNVHSYGPSDSVSGWRTCSTCGTVNVAPPENSGAIDMSIRQ